ncbi:MAG: PQQ-binding-like beta-propeller repeat protein [Planctomycetota bacterium]
MNETGIPAAENDVEALILGDTFANDEETCIPDAVDREVSMRGDLQQMPLADVFQSLGMSKMEGILRVRNLVETREIYFRDGLVRSFIPTRVELRRIGVQLVQGGLMTPETLRAVMFEHKKSRQDMRALLVEHRVLPEAEIDELFDHRAAEDLYSLFTWSQGSFEFYKGPPTDPVILARFDELKPFDINVVLMEVARRSDEWEVIFDSIRSVDELVVPGDDLDGVRGDHVEVLNALDGKRTLRMLAPSMLFGLFELSRIVRDLLESGHARFATVPEALDAIRIYLSHNRKKLASALLETLATRPEGHSYADLHAIATLLQEAGEQRRAAATLLSAAREVDDTSAALEMLRDARALAPRSCEVLEHLRDRLLALDDPDRDDELRQITDDYCNALIEDGRLTDALAILEQLDAESPGDSRLAFRRAIVLHKLGRRDEAVTSLMALAERLRAAKQRDQLIVVYEQVLKIDPRRRDVTRALRSIQATQMVRRLRIAAMIVATVGAAFGGVVGWRQHKRTSVLNAARNDVGRLLASGDVKEAGAVVERTQRELGDTPEVLEIRALIDQHFTRQREAAALADAEQRREQLAAAAAQFERGELEAAMQAYANIVARLDEAGASQVRDIVRARCQSLIPAFERLAQELPYAVPAAPGPTLDSKARRQALEDLQAHFADSDLLRAKACLRAIEHELFRACVDPDTGTRLTKACTDIVRAFGLADVRRTAYQSLEASAEIGRRLHPLVIRAKQLEAQHRYKEAAEVFDSLVREHPHEDELKGEFREHAARCTKIAAGLAEVAAATAAADADAARASLARLRREFRDVPVQQLVQLPLRIVTNPPGAQVFVGGEAVGKSPVQTTFVPARGASVRLQLDGYETATAQIGGDDAGLLAMTLVRQPVWTASLNGAVTQTPALSDDAVLAVDRSGRITCLDLADGKERWHLDTRDLSGLLPRPLLFGDRVVVGSVDGSVRCLDVRSGKTNWMRKELPVEVAAVGLGDLWVAAVSTGRLVALDSGSGDLRYDVPLPGRPAGLAISGPTACCVTTQGDVLGIAASNGRILWQAPLGQVITVPPTVADGSAYVVGEDGAVAAFDLETGKQRWRQSAPSLLAVTPAARPSQVVVVANDQLSLLDAKTGEVLRSLPAGDIVTSVACSPRQVLAGTSGGAVLRIVGDAEAMRLQGPGRVTAAPVLFGEWVIVGFEGKSIHAYRIAD